VQGSSESIWEVHCVFFMAILSTAAVRGMTRLMQAVCAVKLPYSVDDKRSILCNSLEYTLRWVHTCNVTAYRNAVTLQVTDTIRSYELNFHPVPHGVTVSCERYTLGLPVCHGSPSDVFVASSGRWWRVTLPVHTCSGRNRIIPLMRRPNTDSTPNKPVT
jgi:hypothetical protein